MRLRLWLAGAAGLIAAAGLAWGADQGGRKVDFDTMNAVVMTEFNASAGHTSDAVFDNSAIHTYRITVADEDWEWLNANPLLEQYVPATVEYEGRVYEDVGLRYKGFFGNLRFCFDERGQRRCDKLPLKLKFSEYDSAGRFFGLQRLNLNSMSGDPTKLHEALAYALYREAGVPAPRTAFARVFVNGELLGLFSVIEQVDEEFVRAWFPDAGQGTLLKEVWPSSDADGERFAAGIRAGPEEGGEKLLRFSQSIFAADEDRFPEVLESWVDPDALYAYLAVDRLIDNWDGIVAWYCLPSTPCFNHNYYWYVDAFEDRVWLIPWDMDHVFEYPSPIRTYYKMPDWDESSSCTQIPVFLGVMGRPPGCDELIRRLSTLSWNEYAAASRTLLEGPFKGDGLETRIDALAELIAPAVAEDPDSQTLTEWQSAVEALRAGARSIRSQIAAKVGE